MKERTAFCCNIHAMSEPERGRYNVLRRKLELGGDRVEELENGYMFRLRLGALSPNEMGEWVEYERRCCPFFELAVEAERENGPWSLRITGREGVKAFVREEFHVLKLG